MVARILVFALLASPALAHANDPDASLRLAIEKGLKRLEQGSSNYIKNRQCFSCHHQALTLTAYHLAKERGFAVNDDRIKEQLDFTVATFKGKHDRIVKGEGIPGANTMAAYALFTLEQCGHAPDKTTAALVEFLLVRQRADGAWPALANRPPSEGSPFTNAALALRALKHYGSAFDKKDRVEKAASRGREWLLNNKPATMEDRMFHLRALVTAEVDRPVIEAARAALVKDQRADGGWSQLSERGSDAYATGGVLTALRQAGLTTTDLAYQKGLQYLVKTQRDDGAWIVETRSKPVQIFFDNGDPGGKSQFISFAATGWAVMALLEAVPIKRANEPRP